MFGLSFLETIRVIKVTGHQVYEETPRWANQNQASKQASMHAFFFSREIQCDARFCFSNSSEYFAHLVQRYICA